MWLVSSNFRSAAASAAATSVSGSRGFTRYIKNLARKATGAARDISRINNSDMDEMFDELEEYEEDFDFDGEADALDGDYYVSDITETEALLVVQDEKGKTKPRCTTQFDEDYEGEAV